MHGTLTHKQRTQLKFDQKLIDGAPFLFSRAMSEIKRGLCNGSDKFGVGYGYDAEPYTAEEPSPITGQVIKVTRFKNMRRP